MDIKAEEISKIIRDQIGSYAVYVDVAEVGSIISLGDGIVQGNARGRDMRTAPLWGLRLFTTYLHDGRAKTLDQAILAHDGQGRYARERYRRLSRDGKDRLLAFLRTL